MRPIMNIAELEFSENSHGDRFQSKIGSIGQRIGAQKLGYNLTCVPPGKRAFPFHTHRLNEEMFFVLEGEGEVRIGPERYAIRKGDVIACPPGPAQNAHQIINTGTEELRYLSVSTKQSPEVVEYPDSGKFGVIAEFPAAPGEKPERFRFVGRASLQLDYFDGE
jgi:uncharacterized cupin superfamily protein